MCRPNPPAFAAACREFFRESSHPPPASVGLVCRSLPEGERHAQEILRFEESAPKVRGFLFFAELEKISHSVWGWGIQSAQEFKISTFSVFIVMGSVELHPLADLIKTIQRPILSSA